MYRTVRTFHCFLLAGRLDQRGFPHMHHASVPSIYKNYIYPHLLSWKWLKKVWAISANSCHRKKEEASWDNGTLITNGKSFHYVISLTPPPALPTPPPNSSGAVLQFWMSFSPLSPLLELKAPETTLHVQSDWLFRVTVSFDPSKNLVENHFGSVAQLCPTLFNSTDSNMPGFPVHHQLPELAQTHVHQVSDAIQPSHAVENRIKHLNGAEWRT